jgi:predicted DCC family thiol-disulfide oxidoreductase YuxK
MSADSVILFDGLCNLCSGSVQFVIKHDKNNRFKFASLQSDKGMEILNRFSLPTKQYDSFVLIENNQAFTRSTAALKVCRHLSGPIRLLYGFIIVPVFIRDALYNFIAANRYKWFGKKDSCMLPTPALKEKFLD